MVLTETVDLTEAQARLPELVSLAGAGTEGIIADGGTPRARLMPLEATLVPARPRTLGLNRGSVVWISDDFDAPLSDEFWSGDSETQRAGRTEPA